MQCFSRISKVSMYSTFAAFLSKTELSNQLNTMEIKIRKRKICFIFLCIRLSSKERSSTAMDAIFVILVLCAAIIKQCPTPEAAVVTSSDSQANQSMSPYRVTTPNDMTTDRGPDG